MTAEALIAIHLGAYALGWCSGMIYMAFRRVIERAFN